MPSNKIKVCHVVNALDVGGMENGVVNISNLIDRLRFIPTICCLYHLGGMSQRLKSDVELLDLRLPEGFKPLNIIRLALLFRKIRPHIVHTHAWGGGSLYGILGAKMALVPVIINGEHGSFFEKKYQIYIQRFLAGLCSFTLSVSEPLKERIVSTLGIHHNCIKVIPNGVDTELFSGKYDCSYIYEELSNKHGVIIDKDSVILGCIGSLKPEKNQIMFLRAFFELDSRGCAKNLKLIFIGEGPSHSELKSFCNEKNLQNKVAFLGKRDDVPQLLSAIHVLVSTSIACHEGMSNVILEAFSSGVPVIATNSIGTSGLVQDGYNGYLIDHQDINGLIDRLVLLTYSSQFRRELSFNVQNSAKSKLNINSMVISYETLYGSYFKI